MHGEPSRHGIVDGVEKLAEFDRPMLRAGLVHQPRWPVVKLSAANRSVTPLRL